MISRLFFAVLAMAFLGLGLNSFAMSVDGSSSDDSTRYKFFDLHKQTQDEIKNKYDSMRERIAKLTEYLKLQKRCEDKEYILPIYDSTKEKIQELRRFSVFLFNFMRGMYIDYNGVNLIREILMNGF